MNSGIILQLFKKIVVYLLLLISTVSVCYWNLLISYISYKLLTIFLFVKSFRKSTTAFVKNNNCNYKKLSIIIATKNSARYIGKTLRNLESTTKEKSNVEIVIVDGGSADKTLEVAKASTCAISVKFIQALTNNYDNISNVIHKSKISSKEYIDKGNLYNIALQYTTGDILLYLRPDCLVPDGYDTIILNSFNSSKSIELFTFKLKFDKSNMKYIINKIPIRIIEYFINTKTYLCQLPTFIQGIAIISKQYQSKQFIVLNKQILSTLEELQYIHDIRFNVLINQSSIHIDNSYIINNIESDYIHQFLYYTMVDQISHMTYSNLSVLNNIIFYLFYDMIPNIFLKFK